MKRALIAIGLLATTSQASPAFARGGLHLEDRWNPQHLDGLPAEVRNALARMCRGSRAEHQFAGYFENSRVLVLHFEHLRCGCLLYTSPSPRDRQKSRMPSSA